MIVEGNIIECLECGENNIFDENGEAASGVINVKVIDKGPSAISLEFMAETQHNARTCSDCRESGARAFPDIPPQSL